MIYKVIAVRSQYRYWTYIELIEYLKNTRTNHELEKEPPVHKQESDCYQLFTFLKG